MTSDAAPRPPLSAPAAGTRRAGRAPPATGVGATGGALTGAAEKELCDAAESYLLTQLERSFYTLDFYKSLLTE